MLYPELDTPSVLLKIDVVEANIARMAALGREAGVKLRPHTKTHKSPEIAKLQLAAGASGITVAKLGEAEVMADAGIDDIVIAFPLIGRQKLERLAALHRKIKIITSADSFEVAEGLSRVGEAVGQPVPVYLEVDTGLGRCGLMPGRETTEFARSLAGLSGIRVTGLMTHEGHAWKTTAHEEHGRIAKEAAEALAETAAALRAEGFPCYEVSVGATPTSFHIDQVVGATEFRPGTYAFNDRNLLTMGYADEAACALTVLATIVGRPAPTRVILDTGSKTLSQDKISADPFMGRVTGHPDWTVTGLSEEHGIVQVPEGADIRIGERLELIPNHACVVTNLSDAFMTVRGGQVQGELAVAARGLSR